MKKILLLLILTSTIISCRKTDEQVKVDFVATGEERFSYYKIIHSDNTSTTTPMQAEFSNHIYTLHGSFAATNGESINLHIGPAGSDTKITVQGVPQVVNLGIDHEAYVLFVVKGK